MNEEQFLVQATVFLAAAVIGVPLLKRLGLSSVLGYIVAGAAIGPWGLALAGDVESVRAFSEIGIVLLLFLIGLELLPSRLWELRRSVFGLGAAQVAATGAVLGLGAWALGVTPGAAAIIGFGLALSSTAVGLQILIERKQLTTPQGRAGFAVLLFQDLAVIPLLAVLPALADRSAGVVHSVGGFSPLVTLLLFASVVVAGRYLLRPYFRVLSTAGSQEVFTAGALLVVLAVGVFMHKLGISMALGAFVAGMLLADSEFRHEIEADIEPFKGLLLGLFFMAVGMSVNFGLIGAEPLQVAGLVIALVAVKAAIVFALARAFGEEAPSAYAVAVVLSQGGEFAFVLFSLAAGEKLLPAGLADLLVAVVTISMLTTPFLVNLLHCLPQSKEPAVAEGASPTGKENPVIIAGFGRFGQIVGRIVATRGIPFTALDSDSEQLDFVTQFGEKAYFGDASRLDLLRAAGADKASVLVIAIDDIEASMKCAAIVKQHFPRIKIFARARNRLHAYQLLDLGITRVWRETFHASADMAGRVLTELGLPDSTAEETVRIFTLHDERLLRRAAAHHADREKLIEIARAGRAELRSLFEQDRG
ncbi:MAG TPA: monovalent cation:proton antiporter-2 (CPA2) family protein [Gemmatimonadales bacterium]|nr:monovalent cation:proton antiporter-2 (CPA2) family protein [Gemmatimonadales bacterium]